MKILKEGCPSQDGFHMPAEYERIKGQYLYGRNGRVPGYMVQKRQERLLRMSYVPLRNPRRYICWWKQGSWIMHK